MALGGTPGHCDALDADGEYVPARHADYPPEAAPLGHALEVWNAIKPISRYTYLYYPAEAGSPGGWVIGDAWGRSLELTEVLEAAGEDMSIAREAQALLDKQRVLGAGTKRARRRHWNWKDSLT